jgi:hypothetical protein
MPVIMMLVLLLGVPRYRGRRRQRDPILLPTGISKKRRLFIMMLVLG